MPEAAMPGGGGPESQGVNFVLSVQDFGTDILKAADKAYQALLDTMKRVAAATVKFTNDLLTPVTKQAAADKANGGVSPIITPFTMNQKALDMMPKFVKASYEWLKQSASGLAGWATQIAIVGSRTRDFRDALAQAEIEGGKFKDQFAGVGALLGTAIGGAVGKTAAAAGTALSGAVVSGAYMYAELYEKIHDVGIMQGWNSQQTEEATHRYLALASAQNLNVNSIANIAHALSEAHIPLTKANEDLLTFAATAVEVSKLKPGGAVTDESVSGAISNMIKIQKFNAQQVAAFLVETTQQVRSSSLTWVDALNLVGPAAQENFDRMFKGLSDTEKAIRVSHLLPQIMAWGAAAKDANVPMEVLQNVMHGLSVENSPEFQHLAAMMGSTGHDLDAIQKRLKGGDLTGGMNELADAVKSFMNSTDSNASVEFFKAFNGLFGEGAALRISNMGKAAAGIDLTAQSMSELIKMNSAELEAMQNTPMQQLALMYDKIKLFWTAIGGTKNQLIITELKVINGLLKELFDYFTAHPTIAGITFGLGVLSTGLIAVATGLTFLKAIGIGQLFTVMGEVIVGAADAMKAFAAGTAAADIAAVPLGVALGVILAAMLGIYELWKHKDFVESWGKKLVGEGGLLSDVPGLPSFVSNKTTFDTKDIKLQKHFQELLGYSGKERVTDKDYESKPDPETAKQTPILQSIQKILKDTLDANTKKTTPLKPSTGIDYDSPQWHKQAPYF